MPEEEADALVAVVGDGAADSATGGRVAPAGAATEFRRPRTLSNRPVPALLVERRRFVCAGETLGDADGSTGAGTAADG
jgi:hypothetical protein